MRFKTWLEMADELRAAWQHTKENQGVCQFNPSMGCHDFAIELKKKLDGAKTMTVAISHRGHESYAQHSFVEYGNRYIDASGFYRSPEELVKNYCAVSRIPYDRSAWSIVNVDDLD